MMADSLRRARIDALREASSRARLALPEIEALDRSLAGRLRSRVEGLLEQSLRELDGPDATGPDVIRAAQELLDEVLGFAYGAAARRVQLEGGMCGLAEAWLDSLSDRADLRPVGVVIPSDAEFMVSLTQVIRLRFVHDGIYGLPVAAHEYGHFVAGELVRAGTKDSLPDFTFPVAEALRNAVLQADRPNLWSLGHEVFADSFATYICGPAYVHMCLRLRFHPSIAEFTADRAHPPPSSRARVILGTLERMAACDPSGFVPMAAQNLRSFWAAASPAAQPDQPDLDQLAKESWDILDANRHTRKLRYATFPRAYELANQFLDEDDPLREGDTIADVVNAAWNRRILTDDRRVIERIGERAGEMCRRLAGS
jgi:hypothetical protein